MGDLWDFPIRKLTRYFWKEVLLLSSLPWKLSLAESSVHSCRKGPNFSTSLESGRIRSKVSERSMRLHRRGIRSVLIVLVIRGTRKKIMKYWNDWSTIRLNVLLRFKSKWTRHRTLMTLFLKWNHKQIYVSSHHCTAALVRGSRTSGKPAYEHMDWETLC